MQAKLPMPTLPNGQWVPNIFQKQADLINLCRSGLVKYILASGPRLSGKTLGVLHALADQAWNLKNANIVIVSVTQSAGYDSGVWTDLVETVLPEWIAGDFGMTWIKEPSIQHVSKKPYCIVSNRFGGKAKFQLESLKNEQEVERRFKSKRYSTIFVNELSNFKHRKTFDTFTECLRVVGLPSNKHLLICDTNPADEGSKSWIYKLWFEFPNLPDDVIREEEREMKNLLSCLEFTIPDNTFVPEERINQLKATLSSNRDLYDRYVLGKWVTAAIDALFVDVFRENVHVLGEIETPGNKSPMILVPEETCFELYTGWDLGIKNSAAAIMEKVFPDETSENAGRPMFKVLDEQVIIDEDHKTEDFVQLFVEKMKYWDEVVKADHVRWIHYSDRNAFDFKDPVSNRYIHQIVWDASPDDTPGGRIQLIGAAKGRNSVQQRVDLFRRLLWEVRLFISKNNCPNVIEMIKSIKRGKTGISPIEKGSRYKHIFDALTYCMSSELVDEIAQAVMKTIREERRENKARTVISIPL